MCHIALALLLTAAPVDGLKAKLAVLPLAAKRVPAQTVEILDEFLAAELDASKRYQVLGANDINAMLGLERMKDAVGCTDTVCAAEIGGALGVEFLLTGSVGTLGDELLVQLTLLDVKNGSVVQRGRGIVTNDEKLYRKAVVAAIAGVLGLAPDAAAARPDARLSPARFRFDITDGKHAFDVAVMTADGASHRCPTPVRTNDACVLKDLAVGKARLSVDAEAMRGYSGSFTVRDRDELYAIEVGSRASEGSVITWTFGGMGLATGAALAGVGIPMGIKGMTYASVPTALIGAGLLVLGFVFDRKVDIDYPGIDAFF
jgi:TolB-like protein